MSVNFINWDPFEQPVERVILNNSQRFTNKERNNLK